MSQQVKEIVLLTANPGTQQLTPATVRTLAYSVRFPDGQSLYDKWNDTLNGGTVPKPYDLVVMEEDNVYTWRTISYSDEIFVMNARFRPSVSNGNSTRTTFKFPLPTEFISKYNLDVDNAVIAVTPSKNSTFYTEQMVRTISSYIENGNLYVVEDAVSNVPSSYTLIEEELSITITVRAQ